MYWFYNLALRFTNFTLGIIARFNPKIRLFVAGRKQTFGKLEAAFPIRQAVIWVHTASLGEFEQGLPVIRQLKKTYPDHKLLVTFFSPSGYEVKKESREADIICYLPIDTKSRVRKFLDIVSPKLALFVKYEVWPNYFLELQQRDIPLLLISAIFKKEQVYFRWYGGFMRKSLHRVSHIFVQDETSGKLLESIGIRQVSVSGDTRFDRVAEILERDNTLPIIETFKKTELCLVGGSTWPEDEVLLVSYINRAASQLKYILVPHDINSDHIKKLKEAINREVLLYSERTEAGLEKAEVLLIDAIGFLTKIYSYADIAYVGGGFATGLHNTLEPAVFGIPVIIGPHFQNFREAVALVEAKGIMVIKDQKSLEELTDRLVTDPEFRNASGAINAAYVQKNRGASIQIIGHIRRLL